MSRPSFVRNYFKSRGVPTANEKEQKKASMVIKMISFPAELYL